MCLKMSTKNCYVIIPYSILNSVYALPGVGEEAFFKLVNTYWGPVSHFEI